MIHDFQISEKFLLVPDLPVEFNPKRAVKEKQLVFHYNKEGKSRYGVLRRDAPNADNIMWFDCEPHYVVHFCNSWSHVNDKGEEVLVSLAVVHPDFEIGLQIEHFDIANGEVPQIERFEFNVTTGKMTRKLLLAGHKLEFPVVNQDFIGYEQRYGYFAVLEDRGDASTREQKDLDSGFYNAVMKYDYKEDKLIKV